MFVSLFLLAFHVFEVFVRFEGILPALSGLGINFLHFGWISVMLSFLIFICLLHEKFVALNALLRCACFFYQIGFNEDSKCSFNICYRNRFLNRITLKVSVNICKKNSIDVVKFVGRQHAFLTDIMDQLNVCYAFQVL